MVFPPSMPQWRAVRVRKPPPLPKKSFCFFKYTISILYLTLLINTKGVQIMLRDLPHKALK